MYYVYQWVDKDTGCPFYVGKGTGNRMHSIENVQYLATKISEHAKSGKPYKGFYFKK